MMNNTDPSQHYAERVLFEIGQNICTARADRGWSQSDLGETLGGVDRRRISAIEKGQCGADAGLLLRAMFVLDVNFPGKDLPLQEEKSAVSTMLGDIATNMSRSMRRHDRPKED